MSRVNRKSPDHEYLYILARKLIRTNGKCPPEDHDCKTSTQEAPSITPQPHTALAGTGIWMAAFACPASMHLWGAWRCEPTCLLRFAGCPPECTWGWAPTWCCPGRQKDSQGGWLFQFLMVKYWCWWLSISSWIISICFKPSKCVFSKWINVQRPFFATLAGWMDAAVSLDMFVQGLSPDPSSVPLGEMGPVCSDAFRISPHSRCATWRFSNEPPSMWKLTGL